MVGDVNSTRENVLPILLTFDADSDYFDNSIAEYGLLQWRGIEEGIFKILNVLSSIKDSFGNSCKVTWFVRADNQLLTIYGDAAYLLKKYNTLWRQCSSRGDEIGWHPHLYRLVNTVWQQETNEEELDSLLCQSIRAVRDAGYRPVSSRIGESYCSNGILESLSALGILCDSTAMPGRIRKDSQRSIDWEGTPQTPYFPSRKDYRHPGESRVDILQVPMSMVSVKASYDEQPLRRYVDLSFFHEALRSGLKQFLPEASLLVSITHPSCVVPDVISSPHGLLSFQIEELRKNLFYIIEICDQSKRPYRFMTISDYCNHIVC